MTDQAKAQILGTIRKSLEQRKAAQDSSYPVAQVIPERGRTKGASAEETFVSEAKRASATLDSVKAYKDVPQAIAAYLSDKNYPQKLKIAPHPKLESLPWEEASELDVSFGAADGADQTGVGMAFAGISETGTVVFLSGGESPTGLNFLVDNHIVVLEKSKIVGAYEDVWARLRATTKGECIMPRAVNWITGPSRTADIEQTLLLGAHGPRRLHILLVDDA
jgi:L-lactate dehydrogenase complex protein LldG